MVPFFRTFLLFAVLSSALLLGCEGAQEERVSVPAPQADEEALSLSGEGGGAGEGDGAEPSIAPRVSSRIRGPATRRPSVTGFEVIVVEVERGEDGHGHEVAASSPVALDVHAEAWHGAGSDPVLLVGDLRFRRYQHPGPGVLRFIAADGSALPAGSPVHVQIGEDGSTRVLVTSSLEVPR